MAVRTTQEVLEVILQPSPAVRVSQETLETVLGLDPNVRVSQEALEAVIVPGTVGDTEASAEQSGTATAGSAGAEGEFVVRCDPRIRWTGHVPVNEFTVRERPRVEWTATAGPTGNVFVVHTAPVVRWIVGPGTATTKCISADGVMPPPDDSTPPDADEQNYVF